MSFRSWQVRSGMVVITSLLFSSACNRPASGRLLDPGVTAKISVSPDKVPTFGELRTILKVDPETIAVFDGNNRRVENATAATWYAPGNQESLVAFFGSSPIASDDVPYRIIAHAPFKGEVGGFRIGQDTEAWNTFLQRERDKCGHMSSYGAGGQVGTQKVNYYMIPLCQPISKLPPETKQWATYEVGVAFTESPTITSIRFQNFHALNVERDGKIRVSSTRPSESAPKILALLSQNSAPESLLKIAMDYFSNPNLDYVLVAALNGDKPLCNVIKEYTAEGAAWARLSKGVSELNREKFWGPESSAASAAANALSEYSGSYSSALKVMSDCCRSRSFGGIKAAHAHLKQAQKSRDTFSNRMTELGIDISNER